MNVMEFTGFGGRFHIKAGGRKKELEALERALAHARWDTNEDLAVGEALLDQVETLRTLMRDEEDWE